MTVWDFLTSPQGQQLVNAGTLVLLAVAGYVSFLAHRTARDAKSKVDDLEHKVNGGQQ